MEESNKKVTVYNRRFEDKIVFRVEEFNEKIRQDILRQLHARGWQDKDCWSEVEDDYDYFS